MSFSLPPFSWRRTLLAAFSALAFSCGGEENSDKKQPPINSPALEEIVQKDVETQNDIDKEEDVSSNDIHLIYRLPAVPPRSEDAFFLAEIENNRTPTADATIETETAPESEKWVKVGHDHHSKWCPQETPIYLAGKCVTLEQTFCKDSDGTEAFFKESKFGNYFEETIAASDPSLGTGGAVTFGLLPSLLSLGEEEKDENEEKQKEQSGTQSEMQEIFPDTCKSQLFLEEYYCSKGKPVPKGIKCEDYLPGAECMVNELNQGFCQQKDVCLTIPEVQVTFTYDNDADGVKESCEPLDVCVNVEGLQTDFLFDNDNNGINDSCVQDLCPALEGIQEAFPYDNNKDGIAENCIEDKCLETTAVDEDFPFYYDGVGSCVEDLCLETPKIDEAYLFYYNGIGSCVEDLCLELEGIQEHLPYDTDSDNQGDSCVPDLCPQISEIQYPFPFDNDNDGTPESCIKDVCPENLMEGPQDDFPYDVDADGINESCVPVDENFCGEPDPAGKYPNSTLYSYNEHWHAGFCIDNEPDSILHVICSEDGTWYTDITKCEMGMPCVKGACAECYDSDGKENFEGKGYVISLQKDGTIDSKSDACIKSTEADYQLDYICENDVWSSRYQLCPWGHSCISDLVDGKAVLLCLPGAPPTCNDPDGTDNFKNAGLVTYTTKEGEGGTAEDKCISTNTVDALLDNVCIEGLLNRHYSWCKADEICDHKIEVVDVENGSNGEGSNAEGGAVKGTLQCIPALLTPTCEDPDGTENYDVKGEVKGVTKHGKNYTLPDDCVNGPSYNFIIDYTCSGGIPQAKYKDCQLNEFCKKFDENSDGIFDLFKCVPACIDTDTEENPTIAGMVYDFNNVPYSDVCEGDVLYQYACSSLTGEKEEAGMTNCANGCDKGKCK